MDSVQRAVSNRSPISESLTDTPQSSDAALIARIALRYNSRAASTCSSRVLSSPSTSMVAEQPVAFMSAAVWQASGKVIPAT